MNDNPLILFLIFLVFDLALVFVRSSMINARTPQLIGQRAQGVERIERTLDLVDRISLRISLRILSVLLHVLLAAALWLWLTPLLAQGQPDLLTGLLALAGVALLIITIEFGIEGIVLHNPEEWAVRFTPVAGVIDLLLRPLSTLFVRLMGNPADLERRISPVTEDELKTWVEEGQEEGSLEKNERQMIYSIFHFGDTLAREIMVPRIDILALDVETSLDEAIQALTLSGHSRVPVYEETIDNVIGLLYAKDLLRVQLQEGDGNDIRQFLRPAYFVPEAKKVDELLREMQDRSVHLAVVVDEYGGMAGLVTMEDIVEEIVGEIRDEYDQSEEMLYQRINEGEYLFHGRIDLNDVNEVLGTHLSRELADSLGGYLFAIIGRVPVGGEEVVVENWTLKIEQVTGRRIRKIRALRREALPVESPQEKANDKR
ncbi:MAG TPA: hemolysin family protein [Anaerolineaceae bacterium]|nr:hemolysin family protein [Anaerolineaceae bacterium]